MKDEVRADRGEAPPADESQEAESWLREAVSAPPAPRLPVAGEVVGGRYRIEALLGRGGMGVVFRARHTVSEKSVALKWMLRPTSDVPSRRSFER
jgi:serine/threonine protein kinase